MNNHIKQYIAEQKKIRAIRKKMQGISDKLAEIVWEKWLIVSDFGGGRCVPFQRLHKSKPYIHEIRSSTIVFYIWDGESHDDVKVPFKFFDDPDKFNEKVWESVRKEEEQKRKKQEKKEREQFERLKKMFEK